MEVDMSIWLHIIEVFHVANRSLLAVDEEGGQLRAGDRFRNSDGSEFVVRSVAFTTAEAWAAGRRGVEVEVIRGPIISGQKFYEVTSADFSR